MAFVRTTYVQHVGYALLMHGCATACLIEFIYLNLARAGKLAKTAGNNKSSRKITASNKFRVGTYSNGSGGQYFTHGQLSFACDTYTSFIHAPSSPTSSLFVQVHALSV